MVTKYGQTDAQLSYNQPVSAIEVVTDTDPMPLAKQSRLGKYELYKSKNGEWHFRLKAGNGEIIAISEGYKSKEGALNGIDSVKRNSQTRKTVELS